jgi:hypothetical protein
VSPAKAPSYGHIILCILMIGIVGFVLDRVDECGGSAVQNDLMNASRKGRKERKGTGRASGGRWTGEQRSRRLA